MFEGTKRFKKAAEIDIRIEGAGGSTASHTTFELTYHRFSVADKEDLITVGLLSDEIFNHPLFLQEKVAKEKKTISAEISSDLQDPRFLAHTGLYGLMFRGMPLSVPVAGTLESIQNLDRRDMSSFCKNNLPNEMLVVSCGGVDIKELVDTFSDVVPFKSDINYVPIKVAVVGKTGITRKKENTHSINVRIGFPSIEEGNKDQPALDLLADILGGGYTSLLMRKIRLEKGLVYHIGSGNPAFSDCGYFSISFEARKENVREVLGLTNETIEQIRSGRMDEEVFLFMKTREIKSAKRGYQTPLDWVNFHYYRELLLNDHYDLADYLNNLQSIIVDDVTKVANKYLLPERMFVYAVGDITEKDVS